MERKKWLKEELEILKKFYEVKGAKKISKLLPNHSLNSIVTKAKRLGLNSKYHPNLTKDELEIAVKDSYSFADVIVKLNKIKNGAVYKQIKKYIEYYEIDTSHFNPYKNNRFFPKIIPLDELLKYGSKAHNPDLKEKLYKAGLKERICEKCGQGEIWNGEKISLILDHINGDHKDNRLENLRIVCPNCNSTLPTHCRGLRITKENYCECGAKISKKSKKCIACSNKTNKSIFQRKVERPPYAQLLKELSESNYSALGKKYGVSDNAIRKWIKYYEKSI